MRFQPQAYGEEVEQILGLDKGGERILPLAMGTCSSEEARRLIQNRTASQLFPHSRAPEAARSGLFLYFSCFEEAHDSAQKIDSPDGSYWHGILHRQEPDAENARYWFRRVGPHPIFPFLLEAAVEISAKHPDAAISFPGQWEPERFILLCEKARSQPKTALESAVLEIQRSEWQLLFDYCARPRT